jgi:hypothetical protein
MNLGYKNKLTRAQSGLGYVACVLAQDVLQNPDAELAPALYAMAEHHEASLNGKSHRLNDEVLLLYSILCVAAKYVNLECNEFAKALRAVADNYIEYVRNKCCSN